VCEDSTGTVTRIASGIAAVTSAACDRELVVFTTSRGEIVAFEEARVSSALHRNATRDVEYSTSVRAMPTIETTSERRSRSPATFQRWTIRAHDGWAWGIAAHGDGFLSCGHDGRVMRIDRHGHARVWAELAAPVRTIASIHGSSIVPSPTIASIHGSNVVPPPAIAGIHATPPPAFDGSMLATMAIVGDERGWLYWLGRDGHVLRSQRAHRAAVTALATDGHVVVSASEDGTVRRWHAKALVASSIAASSIAATSITASSITAFSIEARSVAASSMIDGEVLVELRDFVTSVAFDARGGVIIAGYDGVIRRITTPS
jgi:WD40 repeat protein